MATTYNNLYLDARKQLKRAGIESAQLEAREIVCAAAEKSREQFYRDLLLYASDPVEARVNELVRRRLGGEPVAYLVGEWEFYGLPLEVTAANFGRADRTASPEDIAAGLVNMIYQTIGSSANFIARNTGVEDFVLIGNMSLLPQCASQFGRIAELYRLRFHIPEHREYRTALGAALSCSPDIAPGERDVPPEDRPGVCRG